MKKIMSAALVLIMTLSLVMVGVPAAWADTPTEAGKVFAGYYTDDTYTTPSNGETSYPKFVDEDVLKVKCQLTHLANENDDSTRIRVVTTVDSTRYQKVGFFVSVDGGAEQEYATTKVARRIVGTDGLANLEYEPSVFSAESQYFCAYNFTVGSAKFGTALSFTPFWVTMDGTEVRGEERTIKINECESFNNYLISNAAELLAFATASQSKDFANWKVKLTADIDLNPGCVASESGMTGSPTQWTPISSSSKPFAGTFDGQGHTISGLYLNSTVAMQGLFVKTASTATLKNFKLKNSYLTVNTGSAGANCFGSIAGQAAGTFEKIYSNAIVDGYLQRVGGLVGQTSGALSLTDCWFAGSALIRTNSSYLGGLIGDVIYSTTIDNCVNTGIIHLYGAPGYAGVSGIVGNAQSTLTITNTVNHSEPQYTSTSSNYIGLLVGRKAGTVTVTNSHSIAYSNLSGSANMLVNNTADGADCGRFTKAQAMGLAGYNTYAKIRQLFSGSAAGHWVITNDSLPVLSLFADEYEAGIVDTTWYDAAQDEYTLTTADQLMAFAALSQTNNFSGKTVKLGADITINADMSAPTVSWTSIGSSSYKFAGTFDGQGHTISGLYQVKHTQLQGFFGDVSGATIKNFRLVDSYFEYDAGGNQNAFIGAIAGRASGTFENIYTNATVTSAGRRTAGFVGSTQGAVTITNCWNAGDISVTGTYAYDIGGFVGYAAHPVNLSYCLNSGTISTNLTSGAANIGGFVGYGESAVAVNISYCLHTGSLSVATSDTTGYGLIAGNINGGKAVFKELVAIGQTGIGEYNTTGNTVNVSTVTVDQITGDAAQTLVPAIFAQKNDAEESYWSTVEGGTPVLTTFASVTAS